MLGTSVSLFAANVRIRDSLRSNWVVTWRLIVPDPGALTHAFPPGAARPRHRAGADSAGGRLRRRCSPNRQLRPHGRTPITPIHIGCRRIPPRVEPPARSHDNLHLHDGATATTTTSTTAPPPAPPAPAPTVTTTTPPPPPPAPAPAAAPSVPAVVPLEVRPSVWGCAAALAYLPAYVVPRLHVRVPRLTPKDVRP